MISGLNKITSLITNEALLDLFLLAALITLLVLTIISVISYRKVLLWSLISIPILEILGILFGQTHLVLTITFDVLLTLTIGLCVFEFLRNVRINEVINDKANQFLGNVTYDYYFSTNHKDHITKASDSYMELVSLDMTELKKSKGFPTMLSELKIMTINNREVTEEIALKFLFDYEQNMNSHSLYQFDLQVLIDENPVLLKGIVEPVYYKNKFVARNVYLINDQAATFNDLKSTIKKMVSDLEMDQRQMYALMSLTKNAIMYFDYKTMTYVATEALNTYLEVTKKEFSIEEFFNMIHPEDVASYEEQGSMINSMMPNRAKLRLYINKKYYDVVDDAIYLSKDSRLVSIISLVADPEEVSPKKQREIKNEDIWTELENSNPTDTMQDLLKGLNEDKENE